MGVWDTLFYEDFEQHTGAPYWYTNAMWKIDWGDPPKPGWPNRHSDVRWPGWWTDKLKEENFASNGSGHLYYIFVIKLPFLCAVGHTNIVLIQKYLSIWYIHKVLTFALS